MKFALLFTFCAIFVFSAPKVFAQNQVNEPGCTHQVIKSNPSELIVYLSNKYGFELTEQLLLRKANYEAQNEVTVLYGKHYYSVISKLDQLIALEQNQLVLNDLKFRKSRIVNFTSIENQLIN